MNIQASSDLPIFTGKTHRRLARQLQSALQSIERVQETVETVPALAEVRTKIIEAILGVRHAQIRLDKRLARDFPDRTFSYYGGGKEARPQEHAA
jgi:hypothetical protein